MTTWEYCSVDDGYLEGYVRQRITMFGGHVTTRDLSDNGPDAGLEAIAELGRNGWELVNVTNSHNWQTGEWLNSYFFKKPQMREHR